MFINYKKGSKPVLSFTLNGLDYLKCCTKDSITLNNFTFQASLLSGVVIDSVVSCRNYKTSSATLKRVSNDVGTSTKQVSKSNMEVKDELRSFATRLDWVKEYKNKMADWDTYKRPIYKADPNDSKKEVVVGYVEKGKEWSLAKFIPQFYGYGPAALSKLFGVSEDYLLDLFAGIVDGDGAIISHVRGGRLELAVNVVIGKTDIHMATFLKALFGGHIVNPKDPKKKKAKEAKDLHEDADISKNKVIWTVSDTANVSLILAILWGRLRTPNKILRLILAIRAYERYTGLTIPLPVVNSDGLTKMTWGVWSGDMNSGIPGVTKRLKNVTERVPIFVPATKLSPGWIAGFIATDGSIRVTKDSSVVLAISQGDTCVLQTVYSMLRPAVGYFPVNVEKVNNLGLNLNFRTVAPLTDTHNEQFHSANATFNLNALKILRELPHGICRRSWEVLMGCCYYVFIDPLEKGEERTSMLQALTKLSSFVKRDVYHISEADVSIETQLNPSLFDENGKELNKPKPKITVPVYYKWGDLLYSLPHRSVAKNVKLAQNSCFEPADTSNVTFLSAKTNAAGEVQYP